MSRPCRFLALPVLLLPFTAVAAVRTVGPVSCQFTDLASAVSSAAAGDEIRISKEYAAPTNVLIDKSLTIVGGLPHCFAATPETTTSISTLTSAGSPSRAVLDVRGANVEVSLYHLRLTGNPLLNGLNVQGGALVMASGIEIDNNTALLGAGAWLHDAGSELRAVVPPFSSSLPGINVHDNQAPQGGGVYVGSGALLRRDSNASTLQIWSNTATSLGGSTGRGGGVYLQSGGHASSLNSTFGNSGVLGGAVYVEGRATGQSVTDNIDLQVDGTLNQNMANKGGAIYVAASDEAVIIVDRLFQNDAGSEGGGLWFGSGGSADIRVVEDNGSSGIGGGVYQSAGSLRIREQLVENSASSHGGGIYANGGDRRFDGGIEIARNQSGGDGGAMWAGGDNGTSIPGMDADAGACNATTPCRIEANHADGHGGAFHLQASDLRTFSSGGSGTAGLQLAANTSGDFGGSIYASSGATLRLLKDTGADNFDISRWTANTAVNGGGALAISNSDIVINGAQFGDGTAQNANTAPFGGAIYVAGQGSSGLDKELRGLNLRMIGNSATESGGAIYAAGSARIEIAAVRCSANTLPSNRYCNEFSGNLAARGSAIYTLGAWVDLADVAVTNNLGTDTSSSALHLNGNGDGDRIENVLLANNADHGIVIDDAAATGSVVALNSVTLVDHPGAAVVLADEAGVDLQLENALFWNNGFASVDGLAGAASASQLCSLIGGGQLGAPSMDPLFTSTPRGDYRLGPGSPAKDACLSGPVRDLDGNNRDASPDIGAFEFGGALPPAIFADGFESP